MYTYVRLAYFIIIIIIINNGGGEGVGPSVMCC